MKNNLVLLRYLSGSALKILALVSMTVDHIALFLLDPSSGWGYEAMRCFGRLAFPIFAFLVVEGYFHTKCLWKYMLALLITAIIAEIPWQLLTDEGSHNVVFTLLMGLVAVFLVDHTRQYLPMMVMMTICPSLLATALHLDYEWHGICLMAVFCLFRKHRALILPFGFPFLLEYGIIGPALGLIATLMYNGRRGFIQGQWMKYLFYMYYPLHLTILWLFL